MIDFWGPEGPFDPWGGVKNSKLLEVLENPSGISNIKLVDFHVSPRVYRPLNDFFDKNWFLDPAKRGKTPENGVLDPIFSIFRPQGWKIHKNDGFFIIFGPPFTQLGDEILGG